MAYNSLILEYVQHKVTFRILHVPDPYLATTISMAYNSQTWEYAQYKATLRIAHVLGRYLATIIFMVYNILTLEYVQHKATFRIDHASGSNLTTIILWFTICKWWITFNKQCPFKVQCSRFIFDQWHFHGLQYSNIIIHSLQRTKNENKLPRDRPFQNKQ